MGPTRVVQIVMAVCAVALGAASVANRWPGEGAGALRILIPIAALAGTMIGLLELTSRAERERLQRIRAAIDALATALFDAPGAVRPVTAAIAAAGVAADPAADAAAASSARACDGYAVDGESRGARVTFASYQVVPAQRNQAARIHSLAVVDTRGLNVRFRLRRSNALTKVGHAVGLVNDADVGDAAFDAAWTVDADTALARAVLTAATRARLTSLYALIGPGIHVAPQLQLTRRGLELQWEGALSTHAAQQIRDALLALRDGLLAHQERAGMRVGAAEHYRVAGDAEPAAAQPDDAPGSTDRARSPRPG